ncbi:uncharacterized protein LOC129230198 [Uloborus diversus]|uniref:uncharacterized protein LOC129230198 n=1 Tax=Uloborus diversus TaxID=327109 RepID=UPI0024098E35|nr:uncharacterized protein LOC129230198 [Uloborus diversus]
MKKENEELKQFLKTHHVQERLKPRDAFYGGRTNAVKLYHEGDTKYVDFTSLYPWCKVLPPRSLFLPVLPYRCNGKLMFPLCSTCAENMTQTPCAHNMEEGAFVGTWVSEELKVAVNKGYTVIQMYEVYHFKQQSNTLFKSYIDLFLKIKQESSGWPAKCITSEAKRKYVQEYEEKEGVKLDASKIEKNTGRRQVAKLALNSFWGR